jgi:hypothetical protein
MSATREFFDTWLRENVGNLPAESEVSISVLAQQFEQDAEAAGYGQEIRDEDLGNIETAIEEALAKTKTGDSENTKLPIEESDLAPVMDALEVDDPKSGP